MPILQRYAVERFPPRLSALKPLPEAVEQEVQQIRHYVASAPSASSSSTTWLLAEGRTSQGNFTDNSHLWFCYIFRGSSSKSLIMPRMFLLNSSIAGARRDSDFADVPSFHLLWSALAELGFAPYGLYRTRMKRSPIPRPAFALRYQRRQNLKARSVSIPLALSEITESVVSRPAPARLINPI